MTSETDAEFLDSMEQWVIGSLVFKAEHRKRLFALARRGAAAAARIEQLEDAVLRGNKTWNALSDQCDAKDARIEQLEAALKPLCCTCDRAASDECSRSEVNCPFWNARAALGEERT